MEFDAITATGGSSAAPSTTSGSNPTQALGADDFLQLLVTQLANQDPLEPTSNEQLLNQLSSIQEIQLSTSLVDSMTALVGNQRYGAVASMIGKHVSANLTNDAGATQEVSGVVTAIRFDASGNAQLELDNGALVAMDQVHAIQNAEQAAADWIGRMVRGVQEAADGAVRTIEGVVTSVRNDATLGLTLELDTGDSLPLSNAALAA